LYFLFNATQLIFSKATLSVRVSIMNEPMANGPILKANLSWSPT